MKIRKINKIKRIYLIGDVAAGKTTFIESFEDKRFSIVRELLWNDLPEKMKHHKKFALSMLFALYYFDRDLINKNQKKIPIFERHLEEELIFADIICKLKKITPEEKKLVVSWTKRLAKRDPITNNDLIIDFTCATDQIRKRLYKRSGKKSNYADSDWDFIRTATIKHFRKYSNYEQIDTSFMTPKEVKSKVIEIINQYCEKDS